MVKMRGSLIAEDVPHWYYGTIYAVFPNKPPAPLVDFEGSEIDFYQRQTDGSYHAYGATVSFFRDRATGKRLTEYTNPYTGTRSEVLANSISVKAYYIYNRERLQALGRSAPAAQRADAAQAARVAGVRRSHLADHAPNLSAGIADGRASAGARFRHRTAGSRHAEGLYHRDADLCIALAALDGHWRHRRGTHCGWARPASSIA